MQYYSILVIIIVMLCIILCLLAYRYPDNVAQLWNNIITTNSIPYSLNGIPTLQYGSNCNSTMTLDKLLYLEHDKIILEVQELLCNNDELMIDVSRISDKIPVLSGIMLLIPDLVSAQIVIHKPGTIMTELQGPFAFIKRYCYGLKINSDDKNNNRDTGFSLDGYENRWRQNVGYVWNNNISQTMWNNTTKDIIVVTVDILDTSQPMISLISRIIYEIYKISPHTGNKQLLKSKMIYNR